MDDWEQIGSGLAAVAAGEEDAWASLLIVLSPQIEKLARRQPIGRLRDDEDAHRDIVASVLGKLHRDDYKVVKKLISHDDPPPIEAWFRVLVKRAAIDIMRGQPEYVRGSKDRDPAWLSLTTLVTRDGAREPDSLIAKRREITGFMTDAVAAARAAVGEHGAEAADHLASRWSIPALHTRRLVKRIEHYPAVLSMVLAGCSYVEVGDQLELSRREVELIISYIEEFFHARGFAA